MLAASRGAMFFIVGSHKLHCDQLDKYSAIQTANAAQVGALSSNLSSVATERDSLASRIESKPLSRFDAIRHLRAFSRWLYAESH